MMLAVKVHGVLWNRDPPAVDHAHVTAIHPDQRTGLQDVAEPVVVLDDGARLAGLVDDRHQPELSDLVALEGRAGLPRKRGRHRAGRPERVSPTRWCVGWVVVGIDSAPRSGWRCAWRPAH